MYSPNKQVGIVDPALATQQQPAQQIPQTVQQPVQQMTNVPPAPSNTLGQAQPVFNQQTQQNAQGMFGGIDQRQNSVGAPFMLENKDKGNDEKSKSKNNIDKTTGKPYDDSEKGRKERLKREQAAGTRDKYGYQTSSY
jgi:hypothetical protein